MLLTTEKPIIINNPEYKFETVLFLPPNPERRAEGGLRTKGLFKHSYKLVKSECECVSESESSHSLSHTWYICDTDGNPVKPAPDDIQQKILEYVKTSPLTSHISPSLKELPLITVITIVYNGAKYLEQTIQSVINQTYPIVEYIIIDGGSTDGTLDIIKKYEDYIDYWVSEPDKGIYDAMNKGLKVAIGNYISILNSDDYYDKQAIKKSIESIFKNKCDYSFGNIKIIETQSITKPIFPLVANKIYQEMPYPHVTALIPRKIYKDVGLFDTNFKIAADHDMALRIHLRNYKACYVDEVLAYVHAGGISDSYEANRESLRVAIKHGEKPFNAYIIYLKQIIKLFIAKHIPLSFLKKIQKIKGSRYGN
jgi:glycosyltransferase involved in cell wall biosynthesis